MNFTRAQAKPLGDFMKERHKIYERKASGAPRPWTKDPVLGTFRFCNVYRELDTVTQWVAANIREPFADSPHLWWMLAAARQINWPGTLADLIATPKTWPKRSLSDVDPARIIKVINDRKAAGKQVFTGAYIITNRGMSITKAEYVALHVLAPLLKVKPPAAWESMEAAHKWLRQYMGFGGFMAYEVVCDMRWTRYGAGWQDVDTWAHAGPGALRGLNRLAGLDKDKSMTEATALAGMRSLLAAVSASWPSKWPALEMREIEHSLCEYDKWVRATTGEGRPRSKYTPFIGSQFS